jgi:uncharacterized protein YukE
VATAAQIHVTYEDVDNVTKLMNDTVVHINPQLTSLANKVSDLLQNGLFLQQSSAPMEHAYQEFTKQLINVVHNIEQYSKQFKSIRDQLQKMDHDISESINKGK